MDSFVSLKNQNKNRRINREVEITALGFRNRPGQQRVQGYPRRMVWNDREVNFTSLGMQYLVRSGQEIVKLFDLSDGSNTYRLRHAGSRWTLVGMKAGAHHG
jgi:hypothetical protein